MGASQVWLNTAGWLGMTLLAYAGALWLYRRAGSSPLLHPLVVTSLCVGVFLWFLDVSVPAYQQASYVLHWLLGPATVALAVPLFKQLHQVRLYRQGILLPVLLGGLMAPLFAVLPLWLSGVPPKVWLTMLSKSITTPLAMDVSLEIGGVPALAAVFVILTGIIGALLADPLFRLFNISQPHVRGVSLGTIAHAVGTAKAVQEGETAAAFSTLALCINGIMTAVLLPLIFGWLLPLLGH